MDGEHHPYRSCLCLAVRRLSRVLTQAYDARLAPIDLRVTQFSLLTALAATPPAGARLAPLAAALDLDASTLTRNLRPLIRAGLVEIEAGADRRERKARLTEAGRVRLEQAMPLWRAAQEEAVAALGAGTSGALAELLAGARRL